MYAIRNMKTFKWVYGTDYRYNPPHQRTSNENVRIWGERWEAEEELKFRKCGKDYEVVRVKVIEVPFDLPCADSNPDSGNA